MFVNHIFAKEPNLPPISQGLYEYVVGQNGIFVRAERPDLSAMIWVAATYIPVRGLAALEPYVRISDRVPAYILDRALRLSRLSAPSEILFYLHSTPWHLAMPDQVRAPASVRPVDPFDPNSANAMIEIHSHHVMEPFFSTIDDRDEVTGFRIYAVIGRLDRSPAILARVGIYGHFYEIPASWVFDLPAGLDDALTLQLEDAHAYDHISTDSEL